MTEWVLESGIIGAAMDDAMDETTATVRHNWIS
jgi:hypothetical protein